MLHAPHYRRFRRNRDTLAAAAPFGGVHQYCAVCGAGDISVANRIVGFAFDPLLLLRLPLYLFFPVVLKSSDFISDLEKVGGRAALTGKKNHPMKIQFFLCKETQS